MGILIQRRDNRDRKESCTDRVLTVESLRFSCEDGLAMNGAGTALGTVDDFLCFGYRVWCAMNNQQKVVCLERDFVLEHAILRDADADQNRSDSAHSANHNRTLKTGDNPGHQRTSHKDRSNTGYGEER